MSGGETFVINVRMTGVGQVEAGAGKVAAANQEMGASAQAASAASAKAASSVGKKWTAAGASMQKVGRTMTTHVTLPLLAVGVAAGKMSLDFNRSMLSVATQAGGTTKEVKKLSAEILTLSAKGRFAQGPQELSEALFHIESTGYRGAKAMKVLKAASDLATVGNADLESTTNALVGAMKTGITGATNMREAIGILNASIGAGNLKMEDLNGAIGTGFLSRAKAVGLTLQDAGAALGELTSQAVPANSAATRLSMTFSLLANPTTKAQGVLKGIGLDSESLAKAFRKPDGLVSALELLQEHMKGLTKIQQSQLLSEAFGGAKSGGTIIALLNNVDDLNKKYKEIGQNAGTFNEKLKETNAEESVKLEKAWSGIRASMIKLGNELLPMVGPLMREVGEDVVSVVHAFTALPDGTKAWIVKIGLVAAALGPVLSLGGTLVKVFGGAAKATQTMAKWLGIVETEQVAAGAAGAVTAVEAGAAGAGAGAAGSKLLGPGGTSIYEELGLAGGGAAAGGAASGGLRAGLKGAAQGLARTVLGVAGGYLVAELGVHGLKAFGVGDPTEGQGIKTSLTHGFDTSGVAKTEADALQKAEGLNFNLSGGQLKRLKKEFTNTMTDLSVSAAGGMSEIKVQLNKGLKVADTTWLHGTGQWRAHTAQAMRGAVRAIERGMEAGTISTRNGHRRINELLRQIHLVKGNDPFGLAEATVKSFKETGHITARGVKAWVNQLEQMPKGAREKSIDATNKMLSAWAAGHPKLEHAIDAITQMQVRKFGATNKQLREGVRKGATGPVAEAYSELAHGVGGALENIGTNANAMLKAVGAKDMVKFQAMVLGPSRSPQLRGEAAAEAHHHGAASGFLSGAGRHDHVLINAAPGEAVATVHQQRHINEAMVFAHSMGASKFGSLPELFAKERTPHWQSMASGGSVQVSGPRSLASTGNSALKRDVTGVDKFLARHMEPGRVLKMLHFAEAQAAKGFPYVFGGGHGSFSGPYDCSGYVSAVLHAGGFLNTPMSVQQGSGLYTLGDSGPGKFFTWGVRGSSGANAHTMMSIKAPGNHWKYFESGGSGGGAHEDHGWDGSFSFRHMPGFAQGGHVAGAPGMPDKVRRNVAKYGAAAFDPRGKHFVGWGYQRGGRIPGFSSGGPVPPKSGELVGASYYGGPTDHVSGTVGAAGVSLPGKMSFAELAMGHALGGLPFHTKLKIGYGGQSVVAEKLDIGLGGGSVGGKNRAIDLWYETANAINMPGLAVVKVAPADGSVTGGTGGSKPSIPKQVSTTYPTTETGIHHGKTHKGKGVVIAGDSFFGKVTGQKKGEVSTSKLPSFGSLPGHLVSVQKELEERRQQLLEYEHAYRQHKDAATRHALQANIALLKSRIKALIKQKARLVEARKKKGVEKKITEKGEMKGWQEQLEVRERSYNKAQEYAEQVVQLEPEKYDAGYAGQEGSAYTAILNSELTWRNTILSAEDAAAQRIAQMEKQVKAIEDLKKKHPRAYRKNRYRIAPLQASIANVQQLYNPVTKLGSFEDDLTNVQGYGKPHDRVPSLPSDPAAGVWGGYIWDTQMSIRELGLKAKEASEEGDAGTKERTDLENELLKQRNEELEREARVHRAQEPVLADYLGAYETGGVLPRTGFYLGHEGEEVLTKDEAGRGRSAVHVLEPHIHVSDELAPYISATIERRFTKGGRDVGLGMGTPSVAGRRAAMKGGS